ncbi:hypothetical protein P9222_00265 [Paenibacillus amylolyticus]|nr:hypothetical protein [Paenibacillus amylolyticus]WFR62932.1 hypothetical protein P9222_00265 [Paenibacillus amylolyticus]
MKKKFDKGAQKVIQKEIVKLSFLEEGQGLPLVIKPNVAGLDLNQWYLNNKDMVEEKILEYGGVLFRGFDTTTPESFYGFIDVSCPSRSVIKKEQHRERKYRARCIRQRNFRTRRQLHRITNCPTS